MYKFFAFCFTSVFGVSAFLLYFTMVPDAERKAGTMKWLTAYDPQVAVWWLILALVSAFLARCGFNAAIRAARKEAVNRARQGDVRDVELE